MPDLKSSAVSCSALSRSYKQGEVTVHALDNVDLEIHHGSFISICGPSGSGKSTLLNLIGGLDVPSSGSVSVAGKEVSGMTRSERAGLRLSTIGFVFQAYNLIPVLSAKENVEFVMQLQGISAAERTERSLEILNAVGLKGLEKRKPGELSGGQQQRVAVARAIVSGPAIVLADEPTANLDSRTSHDLLELMLSMNEARNVTFIFSTHDPLVMGFAKRVVTLLDGRIESDESRAKSGESSLPNVPPG